MFKTIIVAVDGSDHAAKAADVAIDMAKRYGAKLIAISVYRHISQLESTHSLVRARYTPEPPDATLAELARDAVDWVVDRAAQQGALRRRSSAAQSPARSWKSQSNAAPTRSFWAAAAWAT